MRRWPGCWALYSFDRYKKAEQSAICKLVLPDGVDGEEISRIAENVFLARDLINTPANDMGPAELAAAARRAGQTAWREIPRDQRRGAGATLSPDRGGGAGLGPRAAADRT